MHTMLGATRISFAIAVMIPNVLVDRSDWVEERRRRRRSLHYCVGTNCDILVSTSMNDTMLISEPGLETIDEHFKFISLLSVSTSRGII